MYQSTSSQAQQQQSYRSFKSPFKSKGGISKNENTKKKASTTKASSSSSSLNTSSSSSTSRGRGRTNTPFSEKLDRWKRRMRSVSSSKQSSSSTSRRMTASTPDRIHNEKMSKRVGLSKNRSSSSSRSSRRSTYRSASPLRQQMASRGGVPMNHPEQMQPMLQQQSQQPPQKQSSRHYPERTRTRSMSNANNNPNNPPVDNRMYDEVVDGFGKMTSSTSRDEDTQHTMTTANSTQPSYSLDDGSTIVSEEQRDDAFHHHHSSSRQQLPPQPYTHHSFKAGSQTFTVDERYTLTRTVGSGAYGVVISAKDYASSSSVAIKKVPRAFHDEIDAKRILREIKLLKHFRHENIISIKDMMPPLAHHVEDFHDVYIVTDLMETDLHRIIYSKQSLSIDHVQYFLYQILRALKYIHSANVLHRDLKPSNLLVNSNCDLKVCDFGLARGIHDDHDEQMMMKDESNNVGGKGDGSLLLTEYVVTRWYRAPEIMLACHQYSKPVDIWSVGCIFAELLGRKPFVPGDDYIDQLTKITEKLGRLPEEDLDFVTSEKARRFMRKLPDKNTIPLRRQFPGTPPDAIDLLQKMLQMHPRKRITVGEALQHPFFSSLYSPDDEPIADRSFDFRFEDEKLHRVRLQELIWEEVGSFRPSCLPVPPSRKAQQQQQQQQAQQGGFLKKLYT